MANNTGILSKEEIIKDAFIIEYNKLHTDGAEQSWIITYKMNSILKRAINAAMSQYAQQQERVTAIAFAEYRDRYKMEEHRAVKKEQDRVGGIFSWIGKSDSDIYDDFFNRKPIQSEMNEDLQWSYDENGKLGYNKK